MTDRKDTLRRLLAGETVTLGTIAPEYAEHLRRAMDALAERSEREWREARPDTATCTVAIHHVRARRCRAAAVGRDAPRVQGGRRPIRSVAGAAMAARLAAPAQLDEPEPVRRSRSPTRSRWMPPGPRPTIDDHGRRDHGRGRQAAQPRYNGEVTQIIDPSTLKKATRRRSPTSCGDGQRGARW
jgi:hypothetical protein